MRISSLRTWIACMLSLLLLGSTAFAQGGFSAKRLPDQDWEDLFLRHHKMVDADSPYARRVPFDALDFSTIPEWESYEEVQAAFEVVRDERYLIVPGREDFLRRISWLYPDDGCFARAAMMRRFFEERFDRPVAKFFSMGNLRVETPNHPSGTVYWGWHVVPVVRVGDIPYVFDPAIDPRRPLTAEEWALRQTDELTSVRFAICNAYAYTPGGACVNAEPSSESSADGDQRYYHRQEWSRQEALDRDPELVLGDFPPWL